MFYLNEVPSSSVCHQRDSSRTEVMAFVFFFFVVYTSSELPLSITCGFPSCLWMLYCISSLSQPAARILIEETVETKKVEMREGIPPEGKAALLQLSFLLCCAMHKSKELTNRLLDNLVESSYVSCLVLHFAWQFFIFVLWSSTNHVF